MAYSETKTWEQFIQAVRSELYRWGGDTPIELYFDAEGALEGQKRIEELEARPAVSRTEAVGFISKQLGYPYSDKPVGNQHHYGKQELRALLDFLYGGPPQPGEELDCDAFGDHSYDKRQATRRLGATS